MNRLTDKRIIVYISVIIMQMDSVLKVWGQVDWPLVGLYGPVLLGLIPLIILKPAYI